jgi:hypothetical protein
VHQLQEDWACSTPPPPLRPANPSTKLLLPVAHSSRVFQARRRAILLSSLPLPWCVLGQ